MSQDVRTIVERVYQAMAKRDEAEFEGYLDANLEFTAAQNFIYANGNPYRGMAAFKQGILQRLVDEWTGFMTIPFEILGAGDVVIARGRYKGTYNATGTPIDAEFVHVFRFKDGKITAWQTYTDTAQFRDAIHEQTAGAVG